MQAYELAEIGAHIALNGRSLLAEVQRFSDSGLQPYWSASRKRLDRWNKALIAVSTSEAKYGKLNTKTWVEGCGVMSELFMSGLLVRLWTAMACEFDSRHETSTVSPVVCSVLLGHLESRKLALNLMHQANKNHWGGIAGINRP